MGKKLAYNHSYREPALKGCTNQVFEAFQIKLQNDQQGHEYIYEYFTTTLNSGHIVSCI